MSTATLQLQSLQRLTPLIERARERSKRTGRPVLASLTAHLGPSTGYDPSTVIALPDAFVWDQPHRGLALAGAGHAVRLSAAGESRFEDLRDRLSRLLDEAVTLQDSGAALRPAPIAFAGFAFDPSHPDDVAWFGFPEALAFLPRLLVVHSGAHLFLTANLMVDGETEAAPSLIDLHADAETLLAPPRSERADVESRLLDPGPDAYAFWNESVRELIGAIGAGAAEKIVLARRVQVESSAGFDTPAVLGRLRRRFPECTVFAVRAGAGTCFLGATPEMLVALRGREVRADCLAGSSPRGVDDAEDAAIGAALLADDKERREHAIVARGLRDSLAPVCHEVRTAEAPSLRRFANVQHLHSAIEATVDGKRHVLELVERLHPSAATAGLPREASLRLVREQEPFSRGWYAGPIGWIDAEGGGEFAVALRSALIRDDVATLYAGCGIVPGSDAGREWQESQIKLQAMLGALNARSPLPLGEGQGEGERRR
jgi:isochorismate synthase